MKIKLKVGKKKKFTNKGLRSLADVVDRDDDESEESSSSGLITDRNSLEKAMKQQRALANRQRAPEFWLKPGEAKRIRFRVSDPVVGFFAHRLKVKDRWERLIVDRNNDLLSSELDSKKTLMSVWEIINIDGFQDRNGKVYKNVPQFLVASSRLHGTIMGMREELEQDGMRLSSRPVKIKRTGEGVDTSYTFMILDKKPLTPEQKKLPRLNPMKYYKALTLKQQKAVIADVGGESPY